MARFKRPALRLRKPRIVLPAYKKAGVFYAFTSNLPTIIMVLYLTALFTLSALLYITFNPDILFVFLASSTIALMLFGLLLMCYLLNHNEENMTIIQKISLLEKDQTRFILAMREHEYRHSQMENKLNEIILELEPISPLEDHQGFLEREQEAKRREKRKKGCFSCFSFFKRKRNSDDIDQKPSRSLTK